MKLQRGNDIQIEQPPYHDSKSGALYHQFNDYHKLNIYPLDVEVESEFYFDVLNSLHNPTPKPDVPDVPIFTPSGADKCARELFYKITGKSADTSPTLPYHKRWTRNATLVHEGVQKDLLYMEKYLPDAPFVIHRTKDGRPAWEQNVKTTRIIEHDGVTFGITGMMDGILVHRATGEYVGFEFKTKSNSVAQVGTYKMKEPSPSHIKQCVGYSLLFGIDDYILMYEAIAKDGWMKAEDARIDIRTFDLVVTDSDRHTLLQKFKDVTTAIQTGEVPERELDKCLFCKYGSVCK